ncbi:MAG: hypothetical protein ACRDSJ_10515 [Rubrobacteraceae bacterium]
MTEVYRKAPPKTTDEGKGERRRTTRHHRVDDSFLELLEEDFGIDRFSLISAFAGVPAAPKKQAIKVCEWAVGATRDAEEAGDALRAWAKKRGCGSYDPRLLNAPDLTFERTAHERRGFAAEECS